MIEIDIAIVSDLHCHHSQQFTKDDKRQVHSYLHSDLLRLPANEHPVQSLLHLINEKTIKAEYLLCPGDVTNQVDVQGFISGWDYVNEIGEAIGAKEIIATLGNHDVDSRYNLSNDDVFKIARGIAKNFPFKDRAGLIQAFWADGYCFIENEDSRILVVNTVKFHSNKESAVKGKMNETQIEGITHYLETNKDDKVQIALCHHHPIAHSRWKLGTEDVIELGDQLLDVLNKHKFDLLVHGHKHDPWLRYSHGNSNSLPIFSSGSFSATGNVMFTSVKNAFHLIHIVKNNSNRACGRIKTWEYLPARGWRRADSGDHFFPPNTGFGFTGNIDDLVNKAEKFIMDGNGVFIEWANFKQQVQEVEYLTPDECIEFREKLEAKGIITHPELPKEPNIIGKPHY